MDEKTALTYAIARAIAYKENGGKPDISNTKSGASGELKSIFQFTPDTWKASAQKYLGDPNAPVTPDNETKVATEKISQWIDKGYNVKQIASMWNAGEGEPDAYTGKFSNGSSSKGVNAKGVNFDVPTYANDVAQYAQKFYKEDLSNQITPQTDTSNQTTPSQNQSQPTTTPTENTPPDSSGQSITPTLNSISDLITNMAKT